MHHAHATNAVPVGLTEFSKHHLIREPDDIECKRAVAAVEEAAARAMADRDEPWAYGADELYLRAGVELPPAELYGSFDQVENGVGSVRWLQEPNPRHSLPVLPGENNPRAGWIWLRRKRLAAD